MKHSKSLNFSSIFIVLILTSLLYSTENAINIIQDTCKKLSNASPGVYYDFCIAALGPAPGSNNATNVTQLGSVSFKLDISEIDPILNKIETLLKGPNCNPLKNELSDCSELYMGAYDYLVEGLKCFEEGNYLMANTRASAALDGPVTCEDGLKKKQGKVTVLSTENDDFRQLVAISLGFTKLVGVS